MYLVLLKFDRTIEYYLVVSNDNRVDWYLSRLGERVYEFLDRSVQPCHYLEPVA